MFVRKKKNPSGIISVQVIDKHSGVYKVIKTIGSSNDIEEVNKLVLEGKLWIDEYEGKQDLFKSYEKEESEKSYIEFTLNNIEKILINGTELILNRIFQKIGFDAIEDKVFEQLVIARLCQPSSKSSTKEYLLSYFDEDVNLSKIYRYLDKLHNTQQDKIQEISVEHTRKILGGKIGLVFYDVTTLYFETEKTDYLREKGFSKDGKHSQAQVVLGLLVSTGGYPLAYSLFNGSQYEGYTMIPIVEDFVKRFDLKEFVVVADSGLMNRNNINLLETAGYKYIVGARIKNEKEEIKSWILSLIKTDGSFYEINKSDECRLIVGYSEKRAKKRC